MAVFQPRVLFQHQLQKRRKPGKRPGVPRKPDLSLEQILGWVDAFHERTGRWPNKDSGAIEGSSETWIAIDYCLRSGMRAPFGGSSLARLLCDQRGVRNIGNLPPLTTDQILKWADSHHERTGEWPIVTSGDIVDAPGETWTAMEMALRNGNRGLPGGSSLAQLLAQERGKRNIASLPRLYTDVILAWADAHYKRTGKWPTSYSGPVAEAPDENWYSIDANLNYGNRGLPGGTTLSRLLAKRRGIRNRSSLPPLSQTQILSWAKHQHEKTGKWPTQETGSVLAAPVENWAAIDAALRQGSRDLPGNSSLAQLLEEMLGVRNIMALPRLNSKIVLAWADAHFARTGKWPIRYSGTVLDAPKERWGGIDTALSKGGRGLGRGGSSLARFLEKHRGVRNSRNLPSLTTQKILRWADLHHERTGDWPKDASGPISDAPGETWRAMDAALRKGSRGLSGGSTLAQLLESERGKRNLATLPPITEEMILQWADAYRERTGKWPSYASGPIAEGLTERWTTVNGCLHSGGRGLPGGSSLALLLAARRGARNRTSLPKLRIAQIVKWAKDHFTKTGKWPTQRSGPILAAPMETWRAVEHASRIGMRGLPGNSSLAEILDDHLDERKKTRRQETRLAKRNRHEKGKEPVDQGRA
jgi:hypothetical protein